MVIQGKMWVALYHNFDMPFQVCMFKHSSSVSVNIVIYMPCYFFIFVSSQSMQLSYTSEGMSVLLGEP
jgi:hypothetical protein